MIDILLAGAFLAAQGGVQTPAVTPPTDDDTRRECRMISEIGSRLSRRRVCATRAEWAERDRQDRQAMNDGRQRSLAPVYDGLLRGSSPGPAGGLSGQTGARCARC